MARHQVRNWRRMHDQVDIQLRPDADGARQLSVRKIRRASAWRKHTRASIELHQDANQRAATRPPATLQTKQQRDARQFLPGERTNGPFFVTE